MKRIFTIVFIYFTINQVFSQVDSTFFYNPDNTQSWFYVQQDIFSFGTYGGMQYSGSYDSSVIDEIEYSQHSQRFQHTVRFNSNSSISDRNTEINTILQSGLVEYTLLTVTKDLASINNYSQDEYALTTDLVLVNFLDPHITDQEVNAFRSRNGLHTHYTPSPDLPGGGWSYGFRINPGKWNNAFEASQQIFTNERNTISRCIPDLGIFKPAACQVTSEMNDLANAGYQDAMWHIRNRGLVVDVNAPTTGVNDADADICECWGEGYHGENIKVALIDFDGFDYSNPDMEGQYLPGWNMIDSTYHTTSFYDPPNANGQHGMTMASLIAAKANGGITYGAVGVAYNAKIIPYLTRGSNIEVSASIHQAILDGADIINLSLGGVDNSLLQSAYFPDVDSAIANGRNGLGCVVIASTGNNDGNFKNWPAADFNVFGVGATDPDDYRGSNTQTAGWGWGWSSMGGSNYWAADPMDGNRPRYNVVAPGTRIFCSWTDDPLNNPSYRYGWTTGTSAATAITSGVAAIVLSKNPGLTQQQVKEAIQNNADIIRPTIYDYNAFSFLPGYSEEAFYGRVNCLAALGSVPVGVEEHGHENNSLTIITLNPDEVGIFFEYGTNPNGCQVEWYDLSGKLIKQQLIAPHQHNHILETHFLSSGMYVINVVDQKRKFQKAAKIVK